MDIYTNCAWSAPPVWLDYYVDWQDYWLSSGDLVSEVMQTVERLEKPLKRQDTARTTPKSVNCTKSYFGGDGKNIQKPVGLPAFLLDQFQDFFAQTKCCIFEQLGRPHKYCNLGEDTMLKSLWGWWRLFTLVNCHFLYNFPSLKRALVETWPL